MWQTIALWYISWFRFLRQATVWPSGQCFESHMSLLLHSPSPTSLLTSCFVGSLNKKSEYSDIYISTKPIIVYICSKLIQCLYKAYIYPVPKFSERRWWPLSEIAIITQLLKETTQLEGERLDILPSGKCYPTDRLGSLPG